MRLPLTFGLSGALHIAALSGLVLPPPHPVAYVARRPIQVLLERRSTGIKLHPVQTASALNPNLGISRRAARVRLPLKHALTLPTATSSVGSLAYPHAEVSKTHVDGASLHPAEATKPSLPEVSLAHAGTSETSPTDNNAAPVYSAAQNHASSEPDGTFNSPLAIPKALYSPLRKYPEEARWEGRTGHGSLGFRLMPDGSVDPDIKVLRSSGHADLDATAVESLRRWRFVLPPGATPSSWYHYPFRFDIS